LRWLEVRVTVAAEAVEAVGEKLVTLGARGFWTVAAGPTRALVSYFPRPEQEGRPDDEGLPLQDGDHSRSMAGEIAGEMRAFLGKLRGWGLDPGPAEVTTRPADEAEWRDAWKPFLHPVRVGKDLIIHPPWEEPSLAVSEKGGVVRRPGDLMVVIDPGQAFGAGDHPTTRGAAELISDLLRTGARPRPVSLAFDLGTGAGVLAVIAAKIGAARVLAVDNDPLAVIAARTNIAANGLGERVEVLEEDLAVFLAAAAQRVSSGAGGLADEKVSLIMANLSTGLILSNLRAMRDALAADGALVVSGIPVPEGEAEVMQVARTLGLEAIDRRPMEGWVSLALARAGSGESGVTGADLRSGGKRLRAVFYTLGCKANLYDTAGLMDLLRREDWEVVAGREGVENGAGLEGAAPGPGPDLYVVNSCAVTARAEAKTRQLIRRLRREHPTSLVALVGCYPEVRRATLRGRGGAKQAVAADWAGESGAGPAADGAVWCGADIVLGTSDRDVLPELLRRRGVFAEAAGAGLDRSGAAGAGLDRSGAAGAGRMAGAFAGERTRATLKVQDGCEQFCSYCVIPYARGPSRSRPAGEILEEATALVGRGFREIVVTGIHLGAWGGDLAPPDGGTGQRPRLSSLIGALAAIPGLARLRLSSVEPMEVEEELLELLAGVPRLCRHLHVPLQSGADRVLARMNRGYSAADYLDVVDRARAAVPLLGLTTDVMVGFPGETEADFRETLDVVRRARFSRLHVFRYSRRPGTPAATMPGQLDAEVMKARSDELIRAGHELGREFREGLVGLTLEVLIEKVSRARGKFQAQGLTDNYVRTVIQEAGPDGALPQPGDLLRVRVLRATADGLVGRAEGFTGRAEGPTDRPEGPGRA
jgi:threonylcarbamoyladenosine tRNA methylthiotransferase MtaB